MRLVEQQNSKIFSFTISRHYVRERSENKTDTIVAILAAGLGSIAAAQSALKIKVYIVSDETVPSSHEVDEALRQK
jgi:hypothetical protein